MKLHRLSLTNYRGIVHRDIEFADSGVTVVSGANEIGKSSMIEALDLLLESKDRSTKKDVKAVKPTHADVGSEVTAEISTGPYRFVYRKRFHKKCETELTVLAPHRDQLTGDEAHERVRAMLEQTVDTGLWQAQRVLQASSTSAVDLAGCDALSRALDVAASDAPDGLAGLSGTEPVLIDKIDAEYARYFTGTGRPTGEWSAAINALKEADAEVAECAALVAEVDERVLRHATLSDELAELAAQRAPAAARLGLAETAAAQLGVLTGELTTARTEADGLAAAEAAANAAQLDRRRLCTEVEDRRAAVTAAQAAAAVAVEAEQTGAAVVAAAEVAAAESAAAHEALTVRVREAQAAVEVVTRRADAQRLNARLARIDAVRAELDGVAEQLSKITLTPSLFGQIEKAFKAVERAQLQAEVAATALQFTAEADLELITGSGPVRLAGGQSWTLNATEPTEVRLPGQLSVRINPGANAVETGAKLAAAQSNLDELLSAAGMADIVEARATDTLLRELSSRRDQLAATLSGILGDDEVEVLRARWAALDVDAGEEAVDPEAAKAEFAAAQQALREASEKAETERKVVAAAIRQHGERSTAAKVSQERADSAVQELTRVSDQLTASRAEQPDDVLQQRAENAAAAAARARARVAELTEKLAQAQPSAVAAELDAAKTAADEVARKHDDIAQALRDISVELTVFGSQGRSGKLDAARIKREHAAAHHARVQRRARAVDLLRSVMTRHRNDTRLRYVEPFRTEVQRLGRAVFGETFEVEVDSELRIVNRTVDGRTVPFESLSGGAREQLGIVARLAVAALISDEDTVPVVIDDALGFSDPERLAKMGALFDTAAADGQVIVLTCSPERYSGISDAHRVQLTA